MVFWLNQLTEMYHCLLFVFYTSGLSCSVVWISLIGSPFRVHCGVRQGGVLSPLLFAIYVDDLISKLRQSGYGLHIGSLFIGSILYADDIALLACILLWPSAVDQHL